ncbi:hypothetical protein PM082_020997 [Marasmius tenuissimus]|nr:hypothetical protein PM082_020997 [Marasmius tenuissimus]
MSSSPKSDSYAMPTMPQAARAPITMKNQPPAASGMVVTRGLPDRGEQTEGPQRLRGGCIPCPDGSICYIIPIPCCCC